jgi:hypothetical protein
MKSLDWYLYTKREGVVGPFEWTVLDLWPSDVLVTCKQAGRWFPRDCVNEQGNARLGPAVFPIVVGIPWFGVGGEMWWRRGLADGEAAIFLMGLAIIALLLMFNRRRFGYALITKGDVPLPPV